MKYHRNIMLIGICLLAGILIAAIFTETSYRFQTRSQDRDGNKITLMIPKGTANSIGNGGASPGIPGDMTFVVGDTLIVKNEDEVDHQLGPLYIPKGTTASLKFSQAENLAYACTFSAENYLGLDVKSPLTLSTRVTGILSAGIPLGTLLALYVVFAIKPSMNKKAVAG